MARIQPNSYSSPCFLRLNITAPFDNVPHASVCKGILFLQNARLMPGVRRVCNLYLRYCGNSEFERLILTIDKDADI